MNTQPTVLLRTRCREGHLIITENAVTIERKGFAGMGGYRESVARATITEVQRVQGMPALFGMGGGSKLTITTASGKQLVAHLVPPADAERALVILGYA
jgi:hypothetical protein